MRLYALRLHVHSCSLWRYLHYRSSCISSAVSRCMLRVSLVVTVVLLLLGVLVLRDPRYEVTGDYHIIQTNSDSKHQNDLLRQKPYDSASVPSMSWPQQQQQQELYVLTVATRSTNYFPFLKESARRHNITLTVLGWGGNFPQHSAKVFLYRNKLRELPPDAVCLAIDAYDAVILSDAREILDKFTASGKRIIYSAEREVNTWVGRWFRQLVWPYDRPKLVAGTSTLKFINGGVAIGYVADLIQLYDRLLSKHGEYSDDQTILGEIWEEDHGAFDLDYSDQLFLNLRHLDLVPLVFGKRLNLSEYGLRVDESSKRIEVVKTNVYPCVLHAPGNINIGDILAQLGYTPELLAAEDGHGTGKRNAMKYLFGTAHMPIINQLIEGRYLAAMMFTVAYVIAPIVYALTGLVILCSICVTRKLLFLKNA